MGTLYKVTATFEERGDTDWFRMKLVAGQTYKISSPVNTLLNVVLPNGEVMTFPIPYSNYAQFVAPVSGDYFLSSTSLGITGLYSITLEDVPDPHPASTDTTETLAVGGSILVNDNSNAVSVEDDWFAIDVVAGQSYLLSTTANNGRVYVVDGTGQTIAIEGYSGQGGTKVHFTATETGRLYAGAQHPGGTSYTLSLQAVADDHGETPGSAGSLTIGMTANGVWETKGDDDAYAVTLTAGTSYNFSVAAQGDITQRGFIRILDQAGAEVWTSQSQANEQSTIFSPTANGVHYVIAGTALSGSDGIGTWNYQLTSSVLAGDLTDNVLTTGTLAVSGESAGSWEGAGDADWFRIDLAAGQSYLFTLNPGSSFNARLSLYDAQGNEVTASFGPQLHHTAAASATYYVAALIGQQAGAYTLEAEAVADDFADNSSTTGVVVGGLMTGVFEVTNDVDWFAVSLVAGRTYSLQGPSGVYDAQGNALTMVDIQDASFTAPTTGTYYLAVSGFAGEYEYGIVQINDDYLESNATIGVLRTEITGTNGAETLSGSDSYETFLALGGDDLLIAGTGYDRFEGGAGIDTLSYAASSVAMEVNLLISRSMIGGQFDDSIVGIENIIGSAFDDQVTGNAAANRFEGGEGTDILRGGTGNDVLFGDGGSDFLVGGSGIDTMVGGLGDDTYYVDDTGDSIGEQAGEGFDRVAARITLALAADADIERLDVEDLTSTNALDLTGSAIANVIYGNDGQNILRGEAGNDELRGFGGTDFLVGGTGTDLMVGGLGDDTFYVDDASDAIGEISGEGNDRIAASVSFVLSNGADVELLEAVNVAETSAFDLTGSDSANTITGNAGVNILRGEGGNDILSGAGGDDFLVGGAGDDVMNGGLGDDTYYVDASGDVVNEFAGEGTADRVATSLSYTLAAGADIERLEAANGAGTGAMDLTGSNSGNAITGNDGANILDGKGGNDVLTGLGGADTYRFSSALGADNVDAIAGFVPGTDRIALDDAIFAALAPGALAADAFRLGTAANDADDRILYDGATGQLFYDADGNGAGAAMLFATLAGSPALAASDFMVI